MGSNVFSIDEDRDVLIDFSEEFVIRIEDIDAAMVQLIDHPSDDAHFNELLGLLNTVSGKASSCNLAPIVEPLKTLEMLVDRLWVRKIPFTEVLRMFTEKLLGLLQYIAQEAAEQGEVSFSLFVDVQSALQPVVNFQGDFESAVAKGLQLLEGQSDNDPEMSDAIDLFDDDDSDDVLFTPSEPVDDVLFTPSESVDDVPVDDAPVSDVPVSDVPAVIADKRALSHMDIIQRDLTLFRALGRLLNDRRARLSRTEVVLPIALGMNALGMQAVDFFQLEAAVHVHDIAMLRLSDEAFQRAQVDDCSGRDEEHPLLAFEMLQQMTLWEEAAEIVYQHQERLDGSGYPQGLKAADICEGAKILGICDTYFVFAHEKPGKKTKQSVINALSEINSREQHFDHEWVVRFNKIVRIQNTIGAT